MSCDPWHGTRCKSRAGPWAPPPDRRTGRDGQFRAGTRQAGRRVRFATYIIRVGATVLRSDAGPKAVQTGMYRKEQTLIEGAHYAGPMLQTIAVILLILWLLGAVSSYTIGGFIHILLVIAIILFLVRLVQGRRV